MKTRHFLLLLVVLVSWWGAGCTPVQRGTDYMDCGGRGEVKGSMDGVEFAALIALSQKGEILQVEYTSPSSLCGLKLTAQGESCEVVLGEVSFVCNTAEVVGFLRPVCAFLPHGEAKTVQKQGENTTLTYPNGGSLILSPKGEPLSFSGEGIDVRVIWWEMGAE